MGGLDQIHEKKETKQTTKPAHKGNMKKTKEQN